MKRICVIGSLNTDLTVRMARFHAPGETIGGKDFNTYAGGKGGNQAVAAARLGESVSMLGKLGDDGNGDFYRRVLDENGVERSMVETVPGVPSGVALIEVDDAGENRIVIVAGANALVDGAQIDRLLKALENFDIFLLQLEIPIETVRRAAIKLHAMGKCVILDPAPAVPLPEDLIAACDFITPNETELRILTKLPTGTDEEVAAAAGKLTALGAKAVIAKLGARGAMYLGKEGRFLSPGFKVSVVDTTAAGDSFNAGLAAAISRDLPIKEALRFANAVGALSATGAGAQGAMPRREAVEALIAAQR